MREEKLSRLELPLNELLYISLRRSDRQAVLFNTLEFVFASNGSTSLLGQLSHAEVAALLSLQDAQ
jgi:hypothetical protein